MNRKLIVSILAIILVLAMVLSLVLSVIPAGLYTCPLMGQDLAAGLKALLTSVI